ATSVVDACRSRQDVDQSRRSMINVTVNPLLCQTICRSRRKSGTERRRNRLVEPDHVMRNTTELCFRGIRQFRLSDQVFMRTFSGPAFDPFPAATLFSNPKVEDVADQR